MPHSWSRWLPPGCGNQAGSWGRPRRHTGWRPSWTPLAAGWPSTTRDTSLATCGSLLDWRGRRRGERRIEQPGQDSTENRRPPWPRSPISLDYHHKQALTLIRDNQAVYVEDLNTAGLMKNRRLARSIADAGWGLFVRVAGGESRASRPDASTKCPRGCPVRRHVRAAVTA